MNRALTQGQGGRNIKITTINGKTTITIDGKVYDPNQANKPIRGAVVPPVPPRAWQEYRIPLVWLDMSDRPIHGIAFGQVGGSTVFWDRTLIVRDGKEIVLLDEKTPVSGGAWEWLDKPLKTGPQVHVAAPPNFKDEYLRHAALFRTPVREHLLAPPAESLAPERDVLALAVQLPRMRLDGFAWAVYEQLEPRTR